MQEKKREALELTLTGTERSEDFVVEKANPLLSLWRSPLTLGELQILDTYLARINSEKPDRRKVRLEKGELEGLLGVARIRKDELEERLRHLLGTVVKIEDERKQKGFTLITLMEKAHAVQDEQTALWTVEMQCSQAAMEYVFNIQQIGYLRYRLRNVTRLKSRYSYVLYLYLEHNRFRMTWTISLVELRKILNCENVETLKQYKFFNSKLLKPCQREIESKTECRFSYEPVKKGRAVVAVKFMLQSLLDSEKEEQVSEQTSVYDYPELMAESRNASTDVELYMDACERTFSQKEMEEISDILRTVPLSILPPGENEEIRRYHHLRQAYNKMMRYDRRKPISNKVAYLIAIIREPD